MLFQNVAKSNVHRCFLAVLLGIMWIAPLILGWIAYESNSHHMKMAFGVCAVGCLLEVYAITFLFGGLNFIRSRA